MVTEPHQSVALLEAAQEELSVAKVPTANDDLNRFLEAERAYDSWLKESRAAGENRTVELAVLNRFQPDYGSIPSAYRRAIEAVPFQIIFTPPELDVIPAFPVEFPRMPEVTPM